jgi:hypothetical protein
MVRGMPLQWTVALAVAVKEFEKIDVTDRTCYSLNILRAEQNLLVVFVPARSAREANLRGGTTSCGPAVEYTLSVAGRVLKRTFYR